MLVISTSLNSQSRSRILASHCFQLSQQMDPIAEFIDLAEFELPRCDGETCYAHPNVVSITEKIKQANGIILSTPIYNYSIGSEVKNLIELTGQAWKQKIAGFLCAAGGQGSYMAVMNLANSLMLDFRTFIVPRFVYATGNSFAGESITDNDLLDRLKQFASEVNRVHHALTVKSDDQEDA